MKTKTALRIFGICLSIFGLVACIPSPVPQVACVDFEPPLVLGTQYGIPVPNTPGDLVFTSNNIAVRVWDFAFIGGGGTFNVATIEAALTSPTSFGTGQIMHTNNINLEFDFSSTGFKVAQVDLKYLDLGGYENLSVNGSSPTYIGDLAKAPSSIGGVNLAIVATPVTRGTTGTLTLTGTVKTIRLGGQEFWIDEVCARE